MTVETPAGEGLKVAHTPGPWFVCRHLESVDADNGCRCGYRGVIYGPEHSTAMAICQPGHEPAPAGQEGSEPGRYPREVEIANAHLIAASPALYAACEAALATHTLSESEKGLPTLLEVGRMLRAALAQALGEQS